MADNTTLNSGSGGDTIRSVAKTATGAKAQVILLDVGGGADGNPEQIVGPSNGIPATLNTSNNIIGYAGSLNFGPLVTTATMTVGTYTTGMCIGSSTGTAGQSAIFQISVFRNVVQPSATLAQFIAGLLAGESAQLICYLFTKNPTNSSNLLDFAAPTFSSLDLKYLACPPFPIAPAVTIGSIEAIGSIALSLPVQNNDSTPTQNLYLVMIYASTASLIIASGKQNDLWFSVSGVKD